MREELKKLSKQRFDESRRFPSWKGSGKIPSAAFSSPLQAGVAYQQAIYLMIQLNRRPANLTALSANRSRRLISNHR